MDKVDSVRAMQFYIDSHLDEKITLYNLAKVSYYSPWYSYRIFIELVGTSPSDYIRRLKLSNSAIELKDTKCKIIGVAYKYGYDSVDGYQRAFYKEFGVNPHEYSKNPIPICLFTPYKKYRKKENVKMSDVETVFITQIKKPNRKVIIKRGMKATDYMEYCREVGCDVWGLLKSISSLNNEPVCMWLPNKYVKVNSSVYVQGVEVPLDYNGLIPEGFDIIELPETIYLMFQGEPFNEEDYHLAIKKVWSAISKYNPGILGFRLDDENPRIQLEPIGERGYIELLPVKK